MTSGSRAEPRRLRPAAFLDRDGTLVRDVGYAKSPDQLELLPGVAEGLARLRRAGFVLVVATNQSGIARGLLTEEDYAAQRKRLDALLGPGARPDAHYHCPHAPVDDTAVPPEACSCRKPRPGLFLRAIEELSLDPSRSVAFGDRARDSAAARAAGVGRVIELGSEAAAGFAAAVDAFLRGERPPA